MHLFKPPTVEKKYTPTEIKISFEVTGMYLKGWMDRSNKEVQHKKYGKPRNCCELFIGNQDIPYLKSNLLYIFFNLR